MKVTSHEESFYLYHILVNYDAGYFDPWLFLSAMRKKAISLGVEYREAEVVGASMSAVGGEGSIDKLYIQTKQSIDRGNNS